MKSAFRWGIALRCIVLAWGACLGLGEGALAQTRGGTVTVGVEQDIAGFDPITVGIYDTGATAAAALLFDTLTRLDDDGKAQPRLAVSWSASPDFKKWTFKLRPGVKFQDGTPFNAEAVLFNYERMMDPANQCRCAFFLNGISNIDAVDELTLVYHLRVPAVDLPALLSPPAVVNVFHSPKAIQAMGADYNRHPVGTGPFKLVSWQAGDRLVLERNPDYWNPDHPYLDRVIIRPLPDPGARFASLVAGDVDIIWNDIADVVINARKNPALRVNQYVGSGVSAIVLNTKAGALSDIRVRQALRYAIDMQGFADSFDEGVRKPAKDPYGQGSFVKCGDTGVLPYDPAKAMTLLKEYGAPVALKFMVTAEPRGLALGQIFQEFWKSVGITVSIDPVDQTTFVTKSFQHDFEIGGWRIADLADPEPQMYADFHTGSPVNIANYSNPEVDKLLEEARATSDREKRIESYCEIARRLNHDVPWIWGLENTYFSIAKVGLMGVHKQYSDTLDVADAWWEKK
ncbi:MAG TPA: ABC transporter substrate-binding protein [Stellaceae bacterium]|nr:ABC transporter substrate-binding protein [Stellaceae bacterium]